MQILKVVQTGEDSSGGRIVLQIVQNPVHLVKLALRIPMPNPQLIAIGLPNGAGFIGPAVPDVAVQVVYIVGFFLPYPKQFIHAVAKRSPAQGHNGEFLPQIIPVYHPELFDCVRRGPILPAGPHCLFGVPYSVFQNVQAGRPVQRICLTHDLFLPFSTASYEIFYHILRNCESTKRCEQNLCKPGGPIATPAGSKPEKNAA